VGAFASRSISTIRVESAGAAVIKNVVIHLMNEQPLLADVEALPAPSDVAFVCTNLRTKNGQRPVFIDRVDSVFVFPYAQIRFVELPDVAYGREADARPEQPGGRQERAPRPAEAPPEPEPELEIDEEFLRRVRDI
jgi:hypothetical protein